MTGAQIFQLISIFGPKALDLIESLVATWSKELTLDEVLAFTGKARKTYQEYLDEAGVVTPPDPT